MSGYCGAETSPMIQCAVPADIPAQVVPGDTAYETFAPPVPVPPEPTYPSATILDGTGWWDGATANQEYITPSVGGEPGVSHTLGWRKGLGIRRMLASPITGRTLVPPRTMPNPRQGPVGFSSYSDNLFLGVQSQSLVGPTDAQVQAAVLQPTGA